MEASFASKPAPSLVPKQASRQNQSIAAWVRPVNAYGYVDGMSLYRGYFVPGGKDPLGLRREFNPEWIFFIVSRWSLWKRNAFKVGNPYDNQLHYLTFGQKFDSGMKLSKNGQASHSVRYQMFHRLATAVAFSLSWRARLVPPAHRQIASSYLAALQTLLKLVSNRFLSVS